MSKKVKASLLFIILIVLGYIIYNTQSLHCFTMLYVYGIGWYIITIINWLENVERTLTEERILIITGIIVFFTTLPLSVLKFFGVWLLAAIFGVVLYNIYKKLKKIEK